MRSFWFYISCIQCLFQVCMAVIIVYYWHTTSTDDEQERYNPWNPYGVFCSVVPKKYRTTAHVFLVVFFTFVFYALMDHFYDFCLDPENDSYASYQDRKEHIKKKKKQKQKSFKRYLSLKKSKSAVKIEDPAKDWRPPLNGDYIIRENIEDLYQKELNDSMRGTSSPHKYSPKIKSPKMH